MTRVDAWRRALICAGVFVAVDQATKQWVLHSIHRGERINVFFGVDLTYVRNTGVAFGALAGGSGVLITVLIVAALLFLAAYFTRRAIDLPWLWLPTGVIIGGALGNLADRARDGAVVDFIDPVLWPAFNIADVGVVVGILGLLYVAERR